MLDRLQSDRAVRPLIEPLYLRGEMAPAAIAKSLSHTCSQEQVTRICANLRRNRRRATNKDRRGGKLDHTLNIAVSSEVYEVLAPYAARRGISVSRLAARLVDAASDCVDAVLDDRQ